MSDVERGREGGRSDPATVVADADVLAADLLVDGAARRALDHVRQHSWVTLVASDPLLGEAETLIADLTQQDLATDWRRKIHALRVRIEQPSGDHPALASAYHGKAAHLLTFQRELQRPRAGMQLRERLDVSVRHPDAFARLFDPESLYRVVERGEYPGPDRDPRA